MTVHSNPEDDYCPGRMMETDGHWDDRLVWGGHHAVQECETTTVHVGKAPENSPPVGEEVRLEAAGA